MQALRSISPTASITFNRTLVPMATFFKQVLDLQYTDTGILQEELNRLLGPGGWSGKLEVRSLAPS